MKYHYLAVTLTAGALLLGANLSSALDDEEAEAAARANARAKHAVTERQAKPKPKPVTDVKLVDINSATKKELKKLPGISDADADKIIAGRPYLSKAFLLSDKIVSAQTYESISSLVIAKPNKASEAKLRELQKQRRTQ